MIHLKRRIRRGLTDAILLPSMVGLVTLLLLVLHEVVLAVG